MPPTVRQATSQDTSTIADILTEAAQWLEQSGVKMWKDDELQTGRIADDVEAGLFHMAESEGEAAHSLATEENDGS